MKPLVLCNIDTKIMQQKRTNITDTGNSEFVSINGNKGRKEKGGEWLVWGMLCLILQPKDRRHMKIYFFCSIYFVLEFPSREMINLTMHASIQAIPSIHPSIKIKIKRLMLSWDFDASCSDFEMTYHRLYIKSYHQSAC